MSYTAKIHDHKIFFACSVRWQLKFEYYRYNLLFHFIVVFWNFPKAFVTEKQLKATSPNQNKTDYLKKCPNLDQGYRVLSAINEKCAIFSRLSKKNLTSNRTDQTLTWQVTLDLK